MSRILVIKIGGNIIDNEFALTIFLERFAAIDSKKILVHGGGKLATQLADKLGVKQEMVDGRRVTDAETLKIVTMVYAGTINKNIVAGLQKNNCNAIGLTGADANLIKAHKRTSTNIDYGFAGDPDHVNTSFFTTMFENGLTPVLAPITHDKSGQLLNTNADTIAQEIAKALAIKNEVSLIYCFEKNGVLLNPQDDSTVIPFINAGIFEELIKDGSASGGMVPKLTNALNAVKAGVRGVTIGNADELEKLVQQKSGTTIIDD